MIDKTTQKNIPRDWKISILSDVSDIIMGQSPESSSYNQNGDGLPFFQGKADFTDSLKMKIRYWTSEPTKLSKAGDILLSVRAPVGDVAISDVDSCIGRGLAAIRAKKDFSDQEFLFQVLQSLNKTLNEKAQGSTFTAINGPALRKIPVAIPPISEQRKIAEILSSVDSEIQIVETIISQAQKLKDGLMRDLLTKGINHTKFKKTELGNTPVEWSIKKLEDVVFFENGKAHENFIDDGGKFIVINSKFIAQDGNVIKRTNQGLKILNKGDIAIVMSDIPQGRALAKCFFVDEDSKYTLNQRIGLLRPLDACNKYFFYVLNRNNYFLNFSNNTSQTNLRKQQVLDCPILIPPILEQKKIVEILDAFEEKLSLNKILKEKLVQIKKGLMSDLLTGRVRTIKN